MANRVEQARKAWNSQQKSCWVIGDILLEEFPIQPRVGPLGGGLEPLGKQIWKWSQLWGYDGSLAALIDLRRVSNAWPKDKRVKGASHNLHRLLAGVPDRFAVLKPGMTKKDVIQLRGFNWAKDERNYTTKTDRAKSALSWLRSSLRAPDDNNPELPEVLIEIAELVYEYEAKLGLREAA